MKPLYTLCTIVLLLGVLLLSSLPSASAQASRVPSQRSSTTRASYNVTFSSTWSESTHPGFPAAAHFSPLIGATHNLSATFWISETLASPGIEQMAERGGTTLLRQEINAAAENVGEIIAGSGLGTSPAAVTTPSFTVSFDHPLVTLVTMIAPSPDWFVGVHDLSLLDQQGEWLEQITVTLYPYDAGSDDGADYTSPNAEATPHQPIFGLRGQIPFSDQPIGTFTFTRMHAVHLPLVVR